MTPRAPSSRKLARPAPPPAPSPWARFAFPLLILAAVAAVFFPVCRNDFVAWDDADNLYQNIDFKPPTPSSIAHYWDWNQPKLELYIPATYTLWGAVAAIAYDAQAGRLSPLPFHVCSLLLHSAAALLVYALLRALRLPRWPSCAGALLFALHPVQVESVAWACGAKDLLSGFFCLCALWCYTRYTALAAPSPRPSAKAARAFYGAATVAFVLAMLSKPSGVSGPLLVLAIATLVIGRPLRRALLDMLPWVLLALPIVIEGMRVQPSGANSDAPSLLFRPVVALDAIAFYIVKLSFPVHLAIDYGRSPGALAHNPQVFFSWALSLLLIGAAWLTRRRAPWAAAALAVFVAALLPVLGIIPFEYQERSTVTDHYLYLALLGPALAAAFALARRPSRALTWMAVLVIALFAARSFTQIATWRNSESLFTHALAVNPNSRVALVNVGILRLHEGRLDTAKGFFTKVLLARPDDLEARINLASALAREGRNDEAIANYQRAIERHPDSAEAEFDVGNLLLRTDRPLEAIPHYRAALARQPKLLGLHANLGVALNMVGKRGDAITEFESAVELDPRDPRLHTQLGDLLASRGDFAGAMEHFEAAVRLAPDLPEARERRDRLRQMLLQIQQSR